MSGFITPPTLTGSLFFNSTFFSSLNLDSRFRNITNGILQASKALVLDANNQITDILGFNNTNIRFDRTDDGRFLQSFNGTSNFNMYHYNNGSVILGTSSAHSIWLQTNNIGRLNIDATGAVSIGGSLACSSLNITPSTATIGGNTVSGCVFRTSGDRFYGQRHISTNSYSLLSLSAGGSYIDSIVYNHSVAPSNLPLISFNASIATTGFAEILGSQSITVSGQRGLLQSSTQTFRSDTVSSVPIGLKVSSWIWSDTGIISSSDKRLKRDINEITYEEAKRLLNVKPISFVSKSDQSNTRQVGFIAQDLIKNELDEVTAIQPNESVEGLIEDDVLSPEGYSWSVSYDRVSVYLLKIVQEQDKRIGDLNDQIKHLTTIIYSNLAKKISRADSQKL